jgi:formamidopyrimidine-DNA glycosylase
MPELPEIETFRQRFLHGTDEFPIMVGKTIVGIDLLWQRSLAYPSLDDFTRFVIDQTIQDINRRGKYLIFNLPVGMMVFHLRMSGDLVIEPISNPIAKHDRLLIHLDGGIRLAFNDTRKFGRVWFTDDSKSFFSHLGPEPLDNTLSADVLYTKLQKRKRKIKPLLLDQSFLAGMGNIYTDEALFHCGIHPETIANTIPLQKAEDLLGSIRKVLTEAIKQNGSSIDWIYRGGEFQKFFQVYQRTGEPCPRCETEIRRIVVGQRGTHFCPSCQKLPVVD